MYMKYHVSVFVRGVSQEGEQQRGKGLCEVQAGEVACLSMPSPCTSSEQEGSPVLGATHSLLTSL